MHTGRVEGLSRRGHDGRQMNQPPPEASRQLAGTRITPHRITKPIQLLAAWLAGLAIVDASFLTAAASIQTPGWASGVLVVAAVVNVPVFLLSLFLLQTKFRPEMQDDTYYSKYLESRYSEQKIPASPVDTEQQIRKVAEKIMSEVSVATAADHPEKESQIVEILKASEVEYLVNQFGDSRSLSELYLYPNLWKELVASWGNYEGFQRDVTELAQAGLVVVPDGNYSEAQITPMGDAVAKASDAENRLWHSKHKRNMMKT
ncbi:MAG: hypothetical protein IH851_04825 [Armatimonadetes bacterium]|nr:hypothetical protein [Armatimonadota bacterium]